MESQEEYTNEVSVKLLNCKTMEYDTYTISTDIPVPKDSLLWTREHRLHVGEKLKDTIANGVGK